jgi:hypothetical protein
LYSEKCTTPTGDEERLYLTDLTGDTPQTPQAVTDPLGPEEMFLDLSFWATRDQIIWVIGQGDDFSPPALQAYLTRIESGNPATPLLLNGPIPQGHTITRLVLGYWDGSWSKTGYTQDSKGLYGGDYMGAPGTSFNTCFGTYSLF